MSTRARRVASSARMRLLRVRPVNATPYGTHLPVLIALASVIRPRRVLELGSGTFSTALFLDREVFSTLEVLESYEDDHEWAAAVQSAVGQDPRLDLRMVPAVKTSVPEDLASFDLIFIDDSRTPAERSETIRRVEERHPRGLVLIHDYEQRSYRVAARGFDNRRAFRVFTPQVGVCWNDRGDASVSKQMRREVARIGRMLEARRNSADVADVEAWKSLLIGP